MNNSGNIVNNKIISRQTNKNSFLLFVFYHNIQCTSIQLLSHVQLFATPWTAAHQASLSNTNSRSLFKLMSIEQGDAIQPSHLLSPPSPHSLNLSQHQFCFCFLFLFLFFFQMSQFFASGGQSIRVSASASVLPMNIGILD